jgi:hypothetical protein
MTALLRVDPYGAWDKPFVSSISRSATGKKREGTVTFVGGEHAADVDAVSLRPGAITGAQVNF